MARYRSREAETEDVNQRRLQRGAVKRQHLTRWAVGHDELAPGVVGPGHLQPTVIETIRDVSSGSGVGQLLVVSATAQSFASGGAYVTADSIVYQHGFDRVTAAGDSIVWPVDAVGEVQVEFAWDTYEGGGTIEIEVDGVVPAWGLIGSGSSGQVGCKRRGVHVAEGAVVKVKVTQTSGVAKTADVFVEFSIPDPTLTLEAPFSGVRLYLDGVLVSSAAGVIDDSFADATALVGDVGNAGYTGTYTYDDVRVMQGGANVLGNSGFESAFAGTGTGTVTGNWNTQVTGGSVTRVGSPVQSGSWSAAIVGSGALAYILQDLTLADDVDFTLDFYAYPTSGAQLVEVAFGWDRGVSGAATAVAQVELTAAGTSFSAFGLVGSGPALPTGAWSRVELEIVMPS